MDEQEHQRLIRLEADGKLFFGIDRVMARQFYTELPVATIRERTGESPYLEKAIVWGAYVGGQLTVIASIVVAFSALGWWGWVALVVCPLVYATYWAFSARGDSSVAGISILVIVAACMHFLSSIGPKPVAGLAAVVLFSLWCNRMAYCSSTFLLRCLAIRNARAFEYLLGSHALVLREI